MNRNLPGFYQAEERNKLSHFTVQGFDLGGIVQAGASDGEEMENAALLGVQHYLAFEPLSKAFDKLVEVKRQHCPETYQIWQLGLHDKNEKAVLNVTLGDGKGSSIFETEWEHPEVKRNWNQGQAAVEGEEEIIMTRFDDFAFESKLDLGLFDTLQLDTQGNEMEILKGMGDTLQQFKYLCIELSITPVYKGETPGAEVAAWLKEKGFTLDSPIYEHNDCFFVRSDIKPESDQTYRGRC